jgi:regulator of sirC expression with transglutaminase-like and TPR domain
LLGPGAHGVLAADQSKAPAKPLAASTEPAAKSVEQIAEAVRKSVVVITIRGRDGKRQGLGTGFVVGADGLIATNLHVIGEGRPIAVELADGQHQDVTAVEASSRALDLALIRIKAKNLTPLELGDSDRLKQGQSVVAIGNPHGLERSIVAGVVSGKRELEGRTMIQLAIPLEPGNSGGPLVDLHGRVQGILTMRSLTNANLGFAVAVNTLKPLLKKPNPIPMARWLTIGTLDPQEWKTVMGANWRQRAGRIIVDGAGSGFGGRSLCLWQQPLPPLPFEIAVTVRLDDESGAAGLVFHADGADRHYGFYPTGGRFRLTRFDGPDVFTWKILIQESSSHYQPGDWNTLKVRIEKDKIRCFINDRQVCESNDTGLTSGQVGLAKFRDTQAEFKNFRVAKHIPPSRLPAEVVARITRAARDLSVSGPPKSEQVDALVADAPASVAVLRDRAKKLDQEAAQLKQLALAVHQKRVANDLIQALQGPEDRIDLIHAALLLARLDNDEIDVDVYRKDIDRMARELAARLPKGTEDKAKLAALNKFLFTDRGFHGSRLDYYNKANSYLNEVLDDREGLPITLAVLYIEMARRIGLKVEGVGLPGHFIVRFVPAKGAAQFLDVYEGAAPMSREEADQRIQAATGRPSKDSDLAAVSKKTIIVRMLHNLLGIARGERDSDAVLRYLDTILVVAPDSAEDRMARALLRYQTGRRPGALEDADWLLEHQPPGLDVDRLQEFRRMLERPER